MGFLQGYGFDRGASDRGLSSALWDDLGIDGTVNNPLMGQFWIDDFCTPSTDDTGVYTTTFASSGSWANDVTTSAGCIGVGLASAAATTNGQGANVQAAEGPNLVAAANAKLYFEARFKIATLATGCVFFIGLSDVQTAIIATATVNAGDHLGFSCVTDDGVILFLTQDSGATAVNGATSPVTLVDDTYIKLGFTLDGISGANSIRAYVNGVETALGFAADPDISQSVLVPSLVCQADGTNSPVTHLDWWATGAKNYDITP